MKKTPALILFSLLVFVSLFISLSKSSYQRKPALAQTPDQWWNNGWDYRTKLRFNNLDTGGFLSNHRVLVRLDSNKINYSQTQNNGEDIRFLQSGDSPGNPLPHHITHWNESGESFVFVQVPSIRESNDDYIWMYYGNPSCPDGQGIDGTWSDDYRAVLPLNEKNTVFKDVSSYNSDPWGNFGSPSMLGFTATASEKSNFEGGRPQNTPVAIYHAGANKTFVVYTDGEEEYQGEFYCTVDGYITYYDHSTREWATPYKLFDNPKEDYPFDQHHYEQILIDNNGYLHAFYAMHNDPILHRKSTYPVANPSWSLTSWTPTKKTPSVNHATYPVAFKASNGDMYLFYRRSESGPPDLWYEPEYYVKSTDKGNTWSAHKVIDPVKDEKGWNTIYLKGVRYTSNPEGVHIVFANHWNHNYPLGNKFKYYYIFFSFSDNHVYAADGADLGTYVDEGEFEVHCLLFNEGPQYASGSIDIDENGHVHIMTTRQDDTGNYKTVWMQWNGAQWTEIPLSKWDGPLDFGHPVLLDIKSSSNIDLYLVHYKVPMIPRDYDAGRCELARYHWDGSSWVRAEVVFGKAGQDSPRIGIVSPVTNSLPELKLIYQEASLSTDWWRAKRWGRIYGYGSKGIVKSSIRAETNSPVGRGVHFDGEKDNIQIQHYGYSGNSFTFDDDRVSVEFLVRFDNLNNAQFPFGKSIGGKGFSLNLDASAQELNWYIGDGSSYHHVKSNKINANEWYYVVTTFTPNEQAIWVNGVKTSNAVDYTPNWGENPLRLGSPSKEDCCFLDGDLGGYFAVRDTVPSDAYIKASKKNFIDKSFVSYGSPEITPGDLNDDGSVNSQDLKILLRNWGDSLSEPRADLNSDGTVNGIDFGEMAGLIQ